MNGYFKLQAVLFGIFNDNHRIADEIDDLVKKIDMDNFAKNIISHPDFSQNDNITLTGTNSGFTIKITNNRIDIDTGVLINATDKSMTGVELNIFLKYVKHIFSVILEHYKAVGNRISIITTKLYQEHVDEILNKNICSNAYRREDIFEWNSRASVREDLDINGSAEQLNIISNLSKSMGGLDIQGVKFELAGVLIGFDINTIPENVEMRIDKDFIETYYNKMESLIQRLEKYYTNLK